jgi:hypothetical protein
VKLYTPSPASAGSTYSHFDQSATPNLLMEPRISDDLTHDVDLTLGLLLDIGWGINTPRGPSPIRHRGVRH